MKRVPTRLMGWVTAAPARPPTYLSAALSRRLGFGALRLSYIEEGDTYTLIELGNGIVIMSPRRSRVDEIADKLAVEWENSGESLETMLAALRDVRAKYGSQNS